VGCGEEGVKIVCDKNRDNIVHDQADDVMWGWSVHIDQ